MSTTPVVRSLADRDAITTSACADLLSVIRAVHSDGGSGGDGIARIVLTGGGAGEQLCRKLGDAATDPATGIDWSKVYIYFGDERDVAVDHPDSNEGAARKAFLTRAAIPEENIFGFRLGHTPLAEAVDAYEAILADTAPNGFDVHLLGMGGEGHINSLFPHTEATRTSDRLVVAETHSPKPPARRATLTLEAVCRADHVWLLVSGTDKRDAVQALITGAQPDDLPAAGARGRIDTVLYTDQVS